MAGAGVAEFNDGNFETDVLGSDQPVLVDFWAPWCGPCRIIAPVIDQLAEESGEKFRFGKLNIDEAPQTPTKYNISGIPTLLIFKNGEEVHRFSGVQSKSEIQKALEAAL